ncbi:TetR/AcrR family transcriptional regulator [Fodinicola feengrottensis]|uniref:TetR/AcrR family transcriptional regulator n=1 Tax=Fodinicola feengrottensis TaxID=435914 RepID=A0ABN2I5D6_9ACTN
MKVSRRERLRAEAVRDIKAIAMKEMAAGGPAAISLRAIAREMGMTAGALYSYFDTRDDLVAALIAEVYTAVAQRLEDARDSRPERDLAGRIVAVGEAYRRWAVGSPDEFRLIYGDPIPGYQAPTNQATQAAEHRACLVLTGLAYAAWPQAKQTQGGGVRWSDLRPEFVALIRKTYPDLSAGAAAMGFRIWGRMYGLVALEVYGHLSAQLAEPGRIYHAELLDLARSLGQPTP